MKTLDKNNTKCYNIMGDLMDINITVAPNSQSAEVTLHISGNFDFWQNPTYIENSYWWSYAFWEQDIIVTVYESGYTPGSNKQKMIFRGKVKTDGTGEINSYITFLIYPLHSETFYNIECQLSFLDNNQNRTTFYSDTFSFRTVATVTTGHQTERGEDLTLKQKQENAIYLYNNLVRKNVFTLESFACLLGISDCAGDLNPTADYIYKIGDYNGANYSAGYRGDMVGYIGKLNTVTIPDSIWWHNVQSQELTVLQNGDTKCDAMIYGRAMWEYYGWEYDMPPYERSGRRTAYFEAWPYMLPVSAIPLREERPLPVPPEDLKHAFAFAGIPVSHKIIYFKYLSGNERISDDDLYDFIDSNAWLSIETLSNFYKVFGKIDGTDIIYTDPDIWKLSNAHQQQFPDLWRAYSSPKNFSKCRNNQIEKIAEFMYWCFVDGDEGNFGIYNYFYEPFPPYSDVAILPPLYNLECVKKKARYWYDFFKKNRPWWPYFRWTI